MHRTRNAAYPQRYRGFKSPSFRHPFQAVLARSTNSPKNSPTNSSPNLIIKTYPAASRHAALCHVHTNPLPQPQDNLLQAASPSPAGSKSVPCRQQVRPLQAASPSPAGSKSVPCRQQAAKSKLQTKMLSAQKYSPSHSNKPLSHSHHQSWSWLSVSSESR